MPRMSLRLRFLRWLHDKIKTAIYKCPEEKLLSEYKSIIEDGKYNVLMYLDLLSIYGEYSQEMQDILVLKRLQKFRIRRNKQKCIIP